MGPKLTKNAAIRWGVTHLLEQPSSVAIFALTTLASLALLRTQSVPSSRSSFSVLASHTQGVSLSDGSASMLL
jgi:hypothetical protein